MNQIWQTVLAVIGSVGGAGVIIVAVVKFTTGLIAERLSQQYESKLTKELESYKSDLSKKNYISQSRFDMEFSIYGKLCESFLNMTDRAYFLFPTGLDLVSPNEEERREQYAERFRASASAIDNARTILGGNAPFIPVEFYESFEEILRLCTRQHNMYTWCGDLAADKDSSVTHKYSMECYERTNEIDKKFKSLIAKLREHLETLEVTEE